MKCVHARHNSGSIPGSRSANARMIRRRAPIGLGAAEPVELRTRAC